MMEQPEEFNRLLKNTPNSSGARKTHKDTGQLSLHGMALNT
jgi:hypothetical protein